MGRMVKRLSQLEIDEVSLVDRPANQHGLVAIAKNYQEDTMGELYDGQGNPVDETDLQHGDYVYDEAGNEYAYTESATDENGDGGAYDGSEYADEGAGELVGKAFVPRGPLAVGQSRASFTADGLVHRGRQARGRAGLALQQAGRGASNRFDEELLATQMFAGRQGRRGARAAQAGGARAGRHVSDNRMIYGSGAAGAAGGYGGSKVGKSFGGQVLEELSKALNDDERDTVIAKAMDAVEDIAKRNDALENAVSQLLQDREYGDYFEIAKGYEVPVETDELAHVLHKAATVMDEDELGVLERVLAGATEITKSYFEEVGFGGQIESDIMAQIAATADGVVHKSGDLGVTREQAIAALFENNPDAYDQYESETR